MSRIEVIKKNQDEIPISREKVFKLLGSSRDTMSSDEYDDIRVKSPNPFRACTKVGERLYDPPHIEREVVRKQHESARCGRSVGARSAERFGYQVLTPTSSYMILT